MADEITLRLKVDGDGTEAKLADTDTQMKKIKNSTDDTSKSLSLADTKVGKMWGTFKSGAQTGIASMKTLKGAIAATGIGLLIIAVTSLIAYFTKSAKGAEQLKVIMAALGQVVGVITDTFIKIGETLAKIGKIIGSVVKGNKSLKEGFKEIKDVGKDAINSLADSYRNLGASVTEAMDLAKRENQLRTDRRNNLIREAEINKEIAAQQLIINDAQKTNAERLQALNIETQLLNERADERIRLAREQYEITKKQNSLTTSSLDDMDKEAQLLADLINAEAERDESQKTALKKRSTLLEAQAAKRKKAYDDEIERLDELKKAEEQREAEMLETMKKEDEASDKANADEIKRLKKHAEEIQKLEDSIFLNSIEDDKERKQAQINIDQKYFEADLQRRLEAEEITQEELLKLKALGIELYAQQRQDADKVEVQEKFDLGAMLKDAAIQTANNVASAILSIQQNKLNDERETELAGRNLTEQQKEQINKKYAKQQQKLDIKAALINTALAVGNALATVRPFIPAGLAAGITAGITGGIQVAVIKRQKYQTGGVIRGASHATGGVDINAEGGEGMVNARSMSNPIIAQEVLRLNNIGNAGAASSVGAGINDDIIASAVIKAIKAIPVILTVNQIKTEEKNVDVLKNRFTQN